MVTYLSRRDGRRPRVQGAGRSDAPVPARPAVRPRRPDADRARVAAGDDALRRHEAPQGAGGGRPRDRQEVGAGEVALPEPGADPADPRPVDRQVHGAPRRGAHRPEERVGGATMTSTETATTGQATATTQVHRIYIKAEPERIWQAITDPEWNG